MRSRRLSLLAGLLLLPVAGMPTLAAQAMEKDSATTAAEGALGKDEMKDRMQDGKMHDDKMHDGMMRSGMIKGNFQGAEGHDASGSFEVVTEAGKSRVVLGRDFEVERGPDVYLVLSPSPKVREGEAVYLAKLAKFKGEQAYDVPGGTDLSRLTHLVLWCKKYAVAMGSAALASGGDAMHK